MSTICHRMGHTDFSQPAPSDDSEATCDDHGGRGALEVAGAGDDTIGVALVSGLKTLQAF